MKPKKPLNLAEIKSVLDTIAESSENAFKDIWDLKKRKVKDEDVKDFRALSKSEFQALTANEKYGIIFDILQIILKTHEK